MPDGAALVRFADAVLAADPSALGAARTALRAAVGDAAERVADVVNQTVLRQEDWDRAGA